MNRTPIAILLLVTSAGIFVRPKPNPNSAAPQNFALTPLKIST